MMAYQKKSSAVDKYRQADSSEVMYATPHRLVQMLMEGALGKIAAARGGIERNEIEIKNAQIKWAISIIDGLQASLNMEVGGEIAANLDSLYTYMISRLGAANSQNSVEILDEVTSLLKEIKEAWDVMPEGVRNAGSIEEIATLEEK